MSKLFETFAPCNLFFKNLLFTSLLLLVWITNHQCGGEFFRYQKLRTHSVEAAALKQSPTKQHLLEVLVVGFLQEEIEKIKLGKVPDSGGLKSSLTALREQHENTLREFALKRKLVHGNGGSDSSKINPGMIQGQLIRNVDELYKYIPNLKRREDPIDKGPSFPLHETTTCGDNRNKMFSSGPRNHLPGPHVGSERSSYKEGQGMNPVRPSQQFQQNGGGFPSSEAKDTRSASHPFAGREPPPPTKPQQKFHSALDIRGNPTAPRKRGSEQAFDGEDAGFLERSLRANGPAPGWSQYNEPQARSGMLQSNHYSSHEYDGYGETSRSQPYGMSKTVRQGPGLYRNDREMPAEDSPVKTQRIMRKFVPPTKKNQENGANMGRTNTSMIQRALNGPKGRGQADRLATRIKEGIIDFFKTWRGFSFQASKRR